MSTAKLIRWSGLSLMLGGIIGAVGLFIHPPADTAVYALYPLWVPAHLLSGIASLLIALGMVGLYARQLEKVGLAGLIGFVLTFVGITLSAGVVIFIDVVVFPLIAARGLDWLDTPNGALRTSSAFQLTAGLGALSLLLGLLLFAIATLRARLLPRWGAWLVILSIPLGIVAGVIISFVGALSPLSPENLQTLFGSVGGVLSLGWAAWGWALWSEKTETVAQAKPTL
jgi:hypothetical protein